MEPPKVKRTMMAQQALEVSDLLNMRFAGMLVGQEPKKRLQVNAPDGPSTDGGKRARQSITVQQPDGGNALMCGWLDVAQKKAELRTYRVIAEHSEQRYHRPFDVTQGEYDNLMREAQSLLKLQGYEVHLHDELAAAAPARVSAVAPAPSEAGSGGKGVIIALVALGLLAAVVAAVVALT